MNALKAQLAARQTPFAPTRWDRILARRAIPAIGVCGYVDVSDALRRLD